ncbi:hypothetical protein FHT97_004031 [Rhizobium sp. BK399]|nr:hypothetical protein [Rhizobium sp. BK181]MBB3543282.1 hypothetical protein [Rhizobium sp. BK399]MCS3741706.1 hypothetical protein [Rhizobium sp. BK661]
MLIPQRVSKIAASCKQTRSGKVPDRFIHLCDALAIFWSFPTGCRTRLPNGPATVEFEASDEACQKGSTGSEGFTGRTHGLHHGRIVLRHLIEGVTSRFRRTWSSPRIEMKGTFRFHEEFGVAVDLINSRRVDLKPLLSGIYPLTEAVQAFEAAGDRSKSMKVQLAF